MALTIETGAIVPDADSYVDIEDVTLYANKRGVVLSDDTDEAVERLIVKAMDFLETQEPQMQGTRVSAEQNLSWPRSGVYLNGFDVAEDSIPSLLKKALCQLALDADVFDLMPTSNGREVIKEKVDVIETTYSEAGSASPQPSLTAFYNILAPLLTSGGSFSLDLTRG